MEPIQKWIRIVSGSIGVAIAALSAGLAFWSPGAPPWIYALFLACAVPFLLPLLSRRARNREERHAARRRAIVLRRISATAAAPYFLLSLTLEGALNAWPDFSSAATPLGRVGQGVGIASWLVLCTSGVASAYYDAKSRPLDARREVEEKRS